ncbi:MAG: hypothetical protein RLZZ93_931, partial [Actinomycetota bacterium]
KVGRVVRALKLSSQPPKAGVPFPPPLAAQLAAATTAALTIDAPADRWIALLEAAAFSPVRLQVNPVSPSSAVSPELTKTVMRLAPLMPQIAALFGVVVDPKAPAPRPLRPQRSDKPQGKKDAARGDRPPRQPRPADGARKPAGGAQKPAGGLACVAPAAEEAVAPETVVDPAVAEPTAPTE